MVRLCDSFYMQFDFKFLASCNHNFSGMLQGLLPHHTIGFLAALSTKHLPVNFYQGMKSSKLSSNISASVNNSAHILHDCFR